MKRTLTVEVKDCDSETYARIANAVWYSVNAANVNFAVRPDQHADIEELNADWRDQEPWT